MSAPRAAGVLVAMALAACGASRAAMASEPAPRALAVANPGFEEAPAPDAHCAPRWDCTMHANPHAFRFFTDRAHPAAGAASFCLEPASKEPWGMVSQGRFDMEGLRGARIRYSAQVRLDAVEGHGAGLFLIAQGGSGNVVGSEERMETGSHGWARSSLELDVPANAFVLEFGLALTGTGRACIDEVRLEVLRPAPGAV